MPTGRTLSVRLTPELEAVVMQDAKDSALTISSVIRMRLKQRYDQILREAQASEPDPAYAQANYIREQAGLPPLGHSQIER